MTKAIGQYLLLKVAGPIAFSALANFSFAYAAETPEETAFLEGFKSYTDRGADGKFRPTYGSGFGSPNPDAPEAINQFGRLVGSYDCISKTPPGLNPHRPDQRLDTALRWDWYYTLDGRAVGDRWFAANSVGEQVRIIDEQTETWRVSYNSFGSLVQGKSIAMDGQFSAEPIGDDAMRMTREDVTSEGEIRKTEIVFLGIRPEGFEWESRTYINEVEQPIRGVISCQKSLRTTMWAGENEETVRPDKEALLALDQAYSDTWRAGDADAVMNLFADDAVLIPHHGDPQISGKDTIRDFWFDPSYPSTVINSSMRTPIEVSVHGDIGIVRGHSSMNYTYNGRTFDRPHTSNVLIARRETVPQGATEPQEFNGWKIILLAWTDHPDDWTVTPAD